MIKATLDMKGEEAASARLKEIVQMVKAPTALYKVTGRRLTRDLQDHFTELDASQANRLGGKRTHFWVDVRTATQNPDVHPDGATVTIAHLAFAQKLYGGVITAKNGKWLTIPINPLAHGVRASAFEQETGKKLFRIGRALMADLDGTPVPIYALCRSVNQKPDPKALPPLAQLTAGVMEAAEDFLARELNR